MYEEMEATKDIVNVSKDQIIKTFILTEKNGKKKGYLTNIGTNTIFKRKK